jgi:octaprenyl-diphosphate synthase
MVEGQLRRLLPNGSSLIDEVCGHLLSTRGKRFRPALLLLSAKMTGEPSREESVSAAAVVELVHTATLIHDDTIDRSGTRRGLSTVNRRWGDTVSILMGDYVYSKVFNLLAEQKMFGAMGILARSTNDMTVAEMAQVENRGDTMITEDDYLSIVEGKTASLLGAACEIGAMVGGGHDGLAKVCSQFGRRIGIAFQIVDDILDFLGDELQLGKARGTDLREGKVTLPLIAARRNAAGSDLSKLHSLTLACFAMDDDESDLDELIGLIDKNGGFEYSRETAARCADSAKSLLESFDDSPSRDALIAAADYIVRRSEV